MKSGITTLKDIAKALHLSNSTVSRALKGSYKISESTQQKVKEYAAHFNYRPNPIAQSLKNKKSRSIGVVLCAVSNNFFAEVISGIESISLTNPSTTAYYLTPVRMPARKIQSGGDSSGRTNNTNLCIYLLF